MTSALALAGTAMLAVPAVAASAAPHVLATSAAWGQAEEVPGTAALNAFGNGSTSSVSCASTGDCSVIGNYTASSGYGEVFVASQVDGAWGQAEEVPGLATLNPGDAEAFSVSCASAGNCSAGGNYSTSSSALDLEAFVVSQANGSWGNAKEVPGIAALNTGDGAQVTSVSCASPGNCSAGGYYTTNKARDPHQAFVVNQVNGTWGQAEEVPGTNTLNKGDQAGVNVVSCASPGNCSAGGYYYPSAGSLGYQAFVANEVDGTWGKAKSLVGTGAYNDGNPPGIVSLSCGSAGDCSAGGNYTPAGGGDGLEPFVVTETGGTWSKAKEVPGIATLNTGNEASAMAVSCTSAGTCSAGGFYDTINGVQQAFVVSQAGGTWGRAKALASIATLNQGDMAAVTALSCASTGTCSAGGYYRDSSGHPQLFVVNEVSGTWRTAEEIPGTGALSTGNVDSLSSLSCAPGGTCSAGGFYLTSGGDQEAFIVSQK
ncbi:MAG TPA: hypothetical protein VGH27_01465 [Streptosporangiaceae bacterium]